jgi:hypothetical protein
LLIELAFQNELGRRGLEPVDADGASRQRVKKACTNHHD